MYVKSAGKYLFLFPIGKLQEVNAKKLKFPYSLLPLILYIILFTYLALFAKIIEALIILCVALIYTTLDKYSKTFMIFFFTGFVLNASLDYLIAVAYGVLAGFVFGSDVYMDEEGHVYLKHTDE